MKVYGKWTVTLPGESYTYDPDHWLGSVWNQIETDLGLTYQEFNTGLAKKSFHVCQWLVWYLRREAGKQEDRLSVNFPLLQLGLEEVDEGEAEAADTPPSDTATSSPSSNDSESDPATGTT